MKRSSKWFLGGVRSPLFYLSDWYKKDKEVSMEKRSHAWMFSQMIWKDRDTIQRWDYWIARMLNLVSKKESAPKVKFESINSTNSPKMWRNCFDGIFVQPEYFIDWLLFGLGSPYCTSIDHIEQRAIDRWEKYFNLDIFYDLPGDHFAYLLSERHIGRGTGYFPTPPSIGNLMCSILGLEGMEGSLNEPCVGTGSMLLETSNSNLKISGAEISPLIFRCCWINMFIYAPWAYLACGDVLSNPNLEYTMVSAHVVRKVRETKWV